MACRPIVFDPLEWIYVMKLVQSLLPELSYERDAAASQTAAELGGVSIDVLRDLDWGSPVVYMPPFSKLADGTVVVAVEGYTARKLERRGVSVDVVVGDMDFQPEGFRLARHAVVHMHGDNYWKIPRGEWIYTVQTWPVGCSYNISGFTDGDRALYLAHYMGSREVIVSGFYPHVVLKRDDEIKRKKLKVASHLLERLKSRMGIKLL